MGCNHTYEESLEQNEYRSDGQGLVDCKAGARRTRIALQVCPKLGASQRSARPSHRVRTIELTQERRSTLYKKQCKIHAQVW
jgi:hypothetical protein